MNTLTGHWPLEGDSLDHSGHENHGVNHGVDLDTGAFDGRAAFIEVPDAPSLRLGAEDFTFAAWIRTARVPDNVAGDLVEKYDPDRRRGFTLVVGSSSGGYQGPGNDRHVHFGIDDARLGEWQDCGRPNAASNYVSNSLTVFDGKLYAATTGAREFDAGCRVFRYDGRPEWTSLARFYSPEGWTPAPPSPELTRPELNEWSRVTSLTVHDGKLFAGTGSCTSSILDAPCDVRGKVFCLEAGRCASYGGDVGSGWKHVAAVRRNGRLEVHLDGRLSASSSAFDPGDFDLTTDRPLRIGFGQTDFFHGRMRDVRVYKGALTDAEIRQLSARRMG